MVDVLIDFYVCSVRAGVKLCLQWLVRNRDHIVGNTSKQYPRMAQGQEKPTDFMTFASFKNSSGFMVSSLKVFTAT